MRGKLLQAAISCIEEKKVFQKYKQTNLHPSLVLFISLQYSAAALSGVYTVDKNDLQTEGSPVNSVGEQLTAPLLELFKRELTTPSYVWAFTKSILIYRVACLAVNTRCGSRGKSIVFGHIESTVTIAS